MHGQARALLRLCHKLGYDEWGHHPDGRQLIFLGDLNNKGPSNHRVIRQVSAWVAAGRAQSIMGNHEWESLAWSLTDKGGRPLLAHTPEHRAKMAEFLKVKRRNPFAYRRHLKFFKSRPLWLDMGEFRCIHACWDEASVAYLGRKLGEDGHVRKRDIRKAYREGSKMQAATQTVLTGPRLDLPKKAMRSLGKADTRMRWWLPEGADMAELAMLKAKTPRSLKGRMPKTRPLYASDVPVFFGHYHLKTSPCLTSDNAVCLDFGAGSGRRLTAYCWSGESDLSEKNLVSVRV